MPPVDIRLAPAGASQSIPKEGRIYLSRIVYRGENRVFVTQEMAGERLVDVPAFLAARGYKRDEVEDLLKGYPLESGDGVTYRLDSRALADGNYRVSEGDAEGAVETPAVQRTGRAILPVEERTMATTGGRGKGGTPAKVKKQGKAARPKKGESGAAKSKAPLKIETKPSKAVRGKARAHTTAPEVPVKPWFERLADARQQAGKTQREVLAVLGASYNFLSTVERGKRLLSVEERETVYRFLGLPVDETIPVTGTASTKRGRRTRDHALANASPAPGTVVPVNANAPDLPGPSVVDAEVQVPLGLASASFAGDQALSPIKKLIKADIDALLGHSNLSDAQAEKAYGLFQRSLLSALLG